MVITREQAGTYRLIARKVRIHPAQGPHREYERPHRNRRSPDGLSVATEFLDTDEPTLIELSEGDRLDLEFALRTRMLEPYTPPKPAKSKKGEPDGETRGE